MVAECQYQSCESEARIKAMRDELYQYKKWVCNMDATPMPDDDRCYDNPGGIFAVPEVTLVQVVALACKEMEKVSDKRCDRILPEQVKKSFDPCKGPLVMCAPEESGGLPSSGPSDSKPLPVSFGQLNPNVWVNPIATDAPSSEN